MSSVYTQIYCVLFISILLCLLVKFVCNIISLCFIDKLIMKQRVDKNYYKICLKSWLFGIIADVVVVIINIIIGKTFSFVNETFFIVLGLCISFIILFFLNYTFIFKSINAPATNRILSTIILSVFTTSYYFHIYLGYTYL